MSTIDYTPAPTVKEFIKAYRPGEFFYDFIIGPVGSGKTVGNIFKLLHMASLQKPSTRDGVRRSRAVIVRNTFPQLKDTTIPSFMTWLKDGEAGTWRASENKFVLRYDDVECEVLFRPLDTADDVARVLSLEVTFAILDEFVQIPQEIVEALAARCGRYPAAVDGGATNWGMWGASNPGNEDDWWYEFLETDKKPLNCFYFKQPSGFSPQAENLKNLPGGAAYYNSQAEGKSERWVKQFIEVAWGWSVAGEPVYPMYTPSLHVAKAIYRPNAKLDLIIGFDAGLTPAAVLMQQDLHGQIIVLSEVVTPFGTTMGAQRFITTKLNPVLNNGGYRECSIIVVGDPASVTRAQSDEKSVVDVFRTAGFKFLPAHTNRLPARLGAVENVLMRMVETGAGFLVNKECSTLLRGFDGRYCYAKRKANTDAEPAKNEYSHVHDALQYGVMYIERGAERAARRREQKFDFVTYKPADRTMGY